PASVPEEVVAHRDGEGAEGSQGMRSTEKLGQRIEGRQVDQVARATDEAELDELDPGSALPECGGDSGGRAGGGNQTCSGACSGPPNESSPLSRGERRRSPR